MLDYTIYCVGLSAISLRALAVGWLAALGESTDGE